MQTMVERETATEAVPPSPRRTGPPWPRIRRALLVGGLVGLLGMAGAEAYSVFLGSNFHMIIPGVYRSAQLSPAVLEQAVRTKGIRTVVNLRGSCDPCPWYIEESRTTHRLNVCQEDLCFSAGHLPSVLEMRRLIEVLDRTEYPILLHCRRGADRTGMIAAAIVLLQTRASLKQARFQLGLRYGHLALGRPAYLDDFLDLYAEWLDSQRLAHSPEIFRRWLEESYCPAECCCDITVVDVPNPIAKEEPFIVRARFRNTSIKPWHLRAGSNAGIHGCYVLWDARGNQLLSGRAGVFDAEVGPNEAIDLDLALPALRQPGKYRLQIDMVDEQHCYFHQTGMEPLEQELEVR
ncbi:MAG TPA: tyrosine-protein phosphatase [Gemmataceae bacterium]|nr:tyrosine-protein phosphatase [Gemmataceae bacterium]